MSSSAPPTGRRWLALAAICLGTFLLLVDVTIVTVALPSIRQGLHADLAAAQWVIDAYALALAALLLPAGSLADVLGTRRVFAAGLVVFTAGSLLCGFAGSGIEIALFRALQGIGGAAVFATSLALLAQGFTGRDRGTAFGIWGAVGSLSMAVAPVLGGVLVTFGSWRGIFLVNVPVGILALVLALVAIPRSSPTTGRRFDLPGAAVFAVALTALVGGLLRAGEAGWADPVIVGALVLAAVAFAVFPLVERRVASPMLKLGLLRIPTFVGGLIAAFGMNASLYAVLVYLVLYLQDGLGGGPLAVGLQVLVITGGSILASYPAGRLSARIPTRWLIGPGLLLIAGGLLLLRAGTGGPWTALIPGMLLAGIGGGLVTPPLASTAVGVVGPQDAGMASGANSTLRQIGIAASVAVLGSVWAAGLAGAHGSGRLARAAAALDPVLLGGAGIAAVAAVLALLLIRPRDALTAAASHPRQSEERTAP